MAGQRVRIPFGCKLPLPVAPQGSGAGQDGNWRDLQACSVEGETLLEEASPVPGYTEGTSGCGTLQSRSRVRSRDSSASGTGESSGQPYKKKKRWGIDDAIVQEILDLLNTVVITPPTKIMDTHYWDDNVDLQNLPINDKDVCLAFQRWNKKLCSWSIKNYLDFYSEPRTYLFQDIYHTGNIYYNIDESVQHVSSLLENSFTNVQQFLQDLVDVIDKRKPKKNTMEIIAPPSTGKTWFFDMICDFFINVGHLKNMNRYSQFPFQDCNNRRIIMWNEPNCHSDFLDTLKTVYGGDRCPAAVKCKDDAVIYRTPVIVTSNNDLFPNCDALNDRRYKYTMLPWAELKEVGIKKPTPLCIGKLLEKYNISI